MTGWNLEQKGEHKQEDWTNFETICKKLKISEWPEKMVLSSKKYNKIQNINFYIFILKSKLHYWN